MGEPVSAWTAHADGLLLHVQLTPKGGRDAIDGLKQLADGRTVLKARVRSAPESGKANDALIALLAQSLSLARSAITLHAGARSRHKTLAITGNSAALEAALQRLTLEME